MTSNHIRKRMISSRKSLKQIKGFTLMEMILVIIILGVMSVGIGGFITLSTQTYLNATSRDELIGNARFVIERLSRELRNVVPNSIRVNDFGTSHCIQFTPIVASGIYLDIPVLPETTSDVISVVPFNDNEGNAYELDSALSDLITVYPLGDSDIYSNNTDVTGKTFIIDGIDKTNEPWGINLPQAVNFTEDSPTARFYITRNQVSYCSVLKAEGTFLVRFEENITSGAQALPTIDGSFMAGYLANVFTAADEIEFTYQSATLTRNAVVQIHLPFTKDGENYVFDHEVHINNVP